MSGDVVMAIAAILFVPLHEMHIFSVSSVFRHWRNHGGFFLFIYFFIMAVFILC